MKNTTIAAAISFVATTGLLACDGESEDPIEDAGEDEGTAPRDNRVELPPVDDQHHTFVGQEVVIEPGEDKMYCFHMVAEEDLALTDIEMLQGEYGHHSIIVASTDPQPAGTIEDCSDDEATSKFTAFLVPVAGAPEGAAYWVEKGTPIVLQSHYVNASDEALLVRDAVHTRRVPIDDVTLWMAPFTTSAFDFEIPGDGSLVETSFDCVIDRDLDLLSVGGHMHELGSSFEFAIGPSEDELQRIYQVDTWVPEFRDVPPVELYASQPLQLAAGTVMRTTCRWENRTGEAAYFPQEMCTGFGVLAGTKELYDCRTGF